ncbi:MAG: Stealth CR1 domain-containing protein [Streptococcaceae bacterium]|jgi:hypothetical protein|nr:Stealth CR1 domain-containing protein [Streptococcaceae bacterium]
MTSDIDIVITWVDGNDPAWQTERAKYDVNDHDDNRIQRYRDMGTLKYVFRGIENFAPWVRKIFFVTWGHLPEWLDTTNPKLVIVNHEDFIPKEYLPTFNSNTIDLNLFRIPDLSENFVYFNDDTFLLKPVKPDFFFKNGKPRCEAILNPLIPLKYHQNLVITSDAEIINEHFNWRSVVRKHPFQWFNPKYGALGIVNFLMLPWGRVPGFFISHFPSSLQRKTFETLWTIESKYFEETCANRFRGALDTNQWVAQWWQMCSGNFVPRSVHVGFGNYYIRDDDANNQKIFNDIRNQKYYLYSINDGVETGDFDAIMAEYAAAFDTVLPNKSSYEKEM